MRLRIDLAYDGGGFYGWAKQPTLRTVQGEIEAALHKILRVPMAEPAAPSSAIVSVAASASATASVSTSATASTIAAASTSTAVSVSAPEPLRLVVAGRTDTGVHASHQVCHVDVSPDILARAVGHMDVPPTVALTRRMQRILPSDIAIRAIVPAPDGFDARFSALERTYVYRIADRACEVDPRMRGFVLHIDDDLDIDAMNKAAAMTIGLHDFGSFATPNPGGTTIRDVKTAYWRRVPTRPLIDGDMTMGERYRTPSAESGLLCFTIVADAFARNMVRSLVNGCVQVGIGKRSLDWFAGKMDIPLREGSTGPIAPQGLTLEHIAYPPDDQLASRAEAIRAKRTL